MARLAFKRHSHKSEVYSKLPATAELKELLKSFRTSLFLSYGPASAGSILPKSSKSPLLDKKWLDYSILKTIKYQNPVNIHKSWTQNVWPPFIVIGRCWNGGAFEKLSYLSLLCIWTTVRRFHFSKIQQYLEQDIYIKASELIVTYVVCINTNKHLVQEVP